MVTFHTQSSTFDFWSQNIYYQIYIIFASFFPFPRLPLQVLGRGSSARGAFVFSLVLCAKFVIPAKACPYLIGGAVSQKILPLLTPYSLFFRPYKALFCLPREIVKRLPRGIAKRYLTGGHFLSLLCIFGHFFDFFVHFGHFCD